MANESSKVSGLAIDNAGGTLTAIGQYCNSMSLSGGTDALEDTGLGDAQRTMTEGLQQAPTVSINGFLNSTTAAIFVPLANGTTISKTVEVKLRSGSFETGEAIPTVTIDHSSGELGTFSAELAIKAGLTSSSVTAVV